jgi:hypothetical protein
MSSESAIRHRCTRSMPHLTVESILDLIWVAVTLLPLLLCRLTSRSSETKTAAAVPALLLLAIILFPCISCSDDSQVYADVSDSQQAQYLRGDDHQRPSHSSHHQLQPHPLPPPPLETGLRQCTGLFFLTAKPFAQHPAVLHCADRSPPSA